MSAAGRFLPDASARFDAINCLLTAPKRKFKLKNLKSRPERPLTADSGPSGRRIAWGCNRPVADIADYESLRLPLIRATIGLSEMGVVIMFNS